MFYETGGKYGFGYIQQGSVVVDLKKKIMGASAFKTLMRKEAEKKIPDPRFWWCDPIATVAPRGYESGKWSIGESDGQEVFIFFGKISTLPFLYNVKEKPVGPRVVPDEYVVVSRSNDDKKWMYHLQSIDGSKMFWRNGKRHRLDGPAIEYKGRSSIWIVNGKRVPNIDEIIERHELSPDWNTWTDAEKSLMRLAL